VRILGLHGYHGSAALLRRQAEPLARALAPVAELVCVDAPALADGDFGWWHAAPGGRYRGWTRTRTWLAAYLAAHGPFDGVLGFSQGAALAALLVAERADFRCAILIGGFASRDPRHARLFERAAGIATPSLHVLGRSDPVVPPEASRGLASRFRAPVIVEHPGGHVIADTPAVHAAARAVVTGTRPPASPRSTP
jgi:predicted esterase